MRTASPKLDTSHLTANQAADLRCRTALELKDRSEYDAAREAMFPLWNGIIGSRPDMKGLHDTVVPEVLLTTGILTGWLGSRSEIKKADDYARDLITESIRHYEALGDSKKIAEARAEIGYCYWRSGANDEARIWFSEALKRLTTEGNTRANALIGLSFVEWAESRYQDSLKVLTDNTTLFEKITNDTFKGTYHNQIESTLERSHRLQKGVPIILPVRSSTIAPQTNISESQRIWSIALTSRTILPTCCVIFAALKKRTNTWSKPDDCSCV